MRWQDWVRQHIGAYSLRITSGHRTVAEEEALGGPASSYHCRGTEQYPGAFDLGGDAAHLALFFSAVKHQFPGRIHELFLNLPHGTSVAIKENHLLDHNPEAGRAQHLHVALWDA